MQPSLLHVAEKILTRLDRPATAQEIIEEARRDPALSREIRGKTPHKTLQARISVDILKKRDGSLFYRNAPARFGLRRFLKDRNLSRIEKNIHIGRRRRREIPRGEVAVVSKARLAAFDTAGFFPAKAYPLRSLQYIDVSYLDAKLAKFDDTQAELMCFVVLRSANDFLTYEVGALAPIRNTFDGHNSIGFIDNIRSSDLDLFNKYNVGFETAARRIVHDEILFLSSDVREYINDVQFLGFIASPLRGNAPQHSRGFIGLIAIIDSKCRFETEGTSLGYRNLKWRPVDSCYSAIAEFDPWSQYLLRAFRTEQY
ncbi:winged helix-turn-helix domain-containing protein [Phreatobacter sp.]|uniref:winged helix-turn-helix domain-containing protein n=1 Tax=Phreatobacter sp. TaxID=1966341 RepID=UPI0022C8FF1F|nr:winged helix-turn-helix domain-containing protein [Phreatobacter sp.]MCZ8315573.1 winged helix-turn-helix domain-containing protein [Phreatobacter sp.]